MINARDVFEWIVNGTLNFLKGVAMGLTIMLLIGVVLGIVAYIVMLLWNYVIPDVIGWKALTFLQAFALLLLTFILFGRWGK
jgi:predicted lipid-binding transport protein (Tim44 family)